MLLDASHIEYDKNIMPYIRNGIIIDTSVLKIFLDGFISARISKKKLSELSEYKGLLDFFDLIKINNEWNKFLITPHILTEVCTHLRNDYNRYRNYKEIVDEISPFLEGIREEQVDKPNIIGHTDFKNSIIEVGDISICVVANNFIKTVKKVAILAKDRRLNAIYKDSPHILIMDYENIIVNLL